MTRDGAAEDGVDEFKGFTVCGGPDFQEDMAELTVAAALLFVLSFSRDGSTNRFAVRNV